MQIPVQHTPQRLSVVPLLLRVGNPRSSFPGSRRSARSWPWSATAAPHSRPLFLMEADLQAMNHRSHTVACPFPPSPPFFCPINWRGSVVITEHALRKRRNLGCHWATVTEWCTAKRTETEGQGNSGKHAERVTKKMTTRTNRGILVATATLWRDLGSGRTSPPLSLGTSECTMCVVCPITPT